MDLSLGQLMIRYTPSVFVVEVTVSLYLAYVNDLFPIVTVCNSFNPASSNLLIPPKLSSPIDTHLHVLWLVKMNEVISALLKYSLGTFNSNDVDDTKSGTFKGTNVLLDMMKVETSVASNHEDVH